MTIDRLPADRHDDLARASRLEWWTLAWMTGVIAIIGLSMGSSQAMKTAWIEDLLTLVPPIVFLVARRFEAKPADERFPFGYQRVNSLAFLIAAVALVSMGGFLLFDAGRSLVMREHATVGPTTVFGQQLWAGWVMIGALALSVIPPVILGRKKLPLARRLQDKVLHTDAMMNKADWMTGLAGIAGIVGIGFALWWADSAAAALISLDILRDGVRSLRSATAELVDGAPRALDSDEIADDARRLREALAARFPGARIKMRETGRYIRVVIAGAQPPEPPFDVRDLWPEGVDRPWRLAAVTFDQDGHGDTPGQALRR